MKRNALALAVVLLVLGCSTGSEPAALSAADEAAIRALLADWDQMVSAGNIAGTSTFLADDYVEMRPVAVVGPEAARAMYEGFTVTYTSAQSTVKHLEGLGNLAYMWTEFHANFTRQNGDRAVQSGNTLWILRKSPDGAWKLVASGCQAASRADTTSAD